MEISINIKFGINMGFGKEKLLDKADTGAHPVWAEPT